MSDFQRISFWLLVAKVTAIWTFVVLSALALIYFHS